jgi:DNA helicase-2/ATP-dependent DNA helicase PcrA
MPDIPDAAESLNDQQLRAVRHRGGHLLVLAGAGSGKTRTLTLRLVSLLEDDGVDPGRILALTFTNRAAAEMRGRVEAIVGRRRGLWMGTFHSFCAWLLRREASRLGHPADYTIYDADDGRRVLRSIIREAGFSRGITPARMAGRISSLKSSLVTPEAAMEQAEDGAGREVAEVYAAYQAELRRSGAFDFDDLLTQALRAIRQNDDVRGHYAGRYRHVLVDEYQDTNAVQHRLLMALAAPGTEVCVVGDDDQSIYGWRGARVENMLDFERDFPGAEVIRLEENYRSTRAILEAASRLVSVNSRRRAKRLWTRGETGSPPTVRVCSSESGEAAAVFDRMESMREDEGLAYGDMAVLYRTNAQSRPFEAEAGRRGIPSQVVGSVRFYERREVKDALCYLRAVLNPADRLSFRRIVNTPRRGVGTKSLKRFEDFVEATGMDPVDALGEAERISGISGRARSGLSRLGELLGRSAGLVESGAPALEVAEYLLAESGYLNGFSPGDPEDARRLANLEELRRSMAEFDREHPGEGLPGFMAEVSLLTSVDGFDSSEEGAVTLMTLHCAKGLEFDCVFLAGVDEGMLPFVRPGSHAPSDLEEERRLMYVGITRARKHLFVTSVAGRRRPGVRAGGPSRFLAEAGLMDGSTPESAPPRSEATEPRVRSAPSAYARGNLVHHPRYGRGLVVRAGRRGEEWQLTVDFGFDEPKVLLTGYVPIEIIKRRGSRMDLD